MTSSKYERRKKTPRTDRVAAVDWSGGAVAVPYEFAQKLEIENRRLKAELKKLKQSYALVKCLGSSNAGEVKS